MSLLRTLQGFTSKGGMKAYSSFGYAVANAGDLNLDGYEGNVYSSFCTLSMINSFLLLCSSKNQYACMPTDKSGIRISRTIEGN